VCVWNGVYLKELTMRIWRAQKNRRVLCNLQFLYSARKISITSTVCTVHRRISVWKSACTFVSSCTNLQHKWEVCTHWPRNPHSFQRCFNWTKLKTSVRSELAHARGIIVPAFLLEQNETCSGVALLGSLLYVLQSSTYR
jgi:hypothetical protein